VFLNQLSAEQKQQFLSQFDRLTQEQQEYAYNKFLSTPPEVQQFAIKQFLSLDPRVLAVSLQEEIRKEQESGRQPAAPRPNPQQPPQASPAEQLALRQQQEALQEIIDLQNSINFPNGK